MLTSGIQNIFKILLLRWLVSTMQLEKYIFFSDRSCHVLAHQLPKYELLKLFIEILHYDLTLTSIIKYCEAINNYEIQPHRSNKDMPFSFLQKQGKTVNQDMLLIIL